MNEVNRSMHQESFPAIGAIPDSFDITAEFGGMADFDINAAFQEAIWGVATDEELELNEKIKHMTSIIEQGTSDVFREFVNFRAMASQMQMACSHDHNLMSSMLGNETLGSFLGEHRDDGHEHGHHAHEKDDDDDEDSIAKKKKDKRRVGWFALAK